MASLATLHRRALLGAALAAAAPRRAGADPARLQVARPTGDFNHFVVYGQSLATGAEGTPALSDIAYPGNLMLGGRVLSTSSVPANIAGDRPDWIATGAPTFRPLVATGGPETVMSGALDTLRALAEASHGLDPTRRFVAGGAGVGGRGIAALSKGASPEYFHRLVSLVAQTRTAAAAAGGSYILAALLWLQGESDMTMRRAQYRTLLRRLRADFLADAAPLGAPPPAMFTYQTTANAQNDRHGLGVQMAQLDLALADPGIFMAGPAYPLPDSGNLHLTANGYRWLGAQFGKAMHRVLFLGQDWRPLHPTLARRQDRTIVVDFHVPVPPLAWGLPYVSDRQGGPNRPIDHPDKGFTVLAGATRLPIVSVALAGPAQVAITLAEPPPGNLRLRYADGAHAGSGNLRDSDPTVAAARYRMGLPRQSPGENLPDLAGKPYPLWNWCAAAELPVA